MRGGKVQVGEELNMHGLTTAAWSARFGILRDDYTPKPAFTALRHLIATASMR